MISIRIPTNISNHIEYILNFDSDIYGLLMSNVDPQINILSSENSNMGKCTIEILTQSKFMEMSELPDKKDKVYNNLMDLAKDMIHNENNSNSKYFKATIIILGNKYEYYIITGNCDTSYTPGMLQLKQKIILIISQHSNLISAIISTVNNALSHVIEI